jgi:hypothetical protein
VSYQKLLSFGGSYFKYNKLGRFYWAKKRAEVNIEYYFVAKD